MSATPFACLLVVILLGSTDGQVVSWGGCPTVEGEKHFNIEEFMGKWFEVARFPSYFENGAKCVTSNYTKLADGSIKVEELVYLSDVGYEETTGVVTQDEDVKSKLYIKYRWWFPSATILITDTDYDHYALIHSCVSAGLFNVQFNWIIAREGELSETLMDNLLYRFEDVGIDITQFEYTVQDKNHCPAQ